MASQKPSAKAAAAMAAQGSTKKKTKLETLVATKAATKAATKVKTGVKTQIKTQVKAKDKTQLNTRAAALPLNHHNVVPDRLDLRDRVYLPPVGVIPARTLPPRADIPVLDQQQTSACTGFALASVVYQLQHSAGRAPAECPVSAFMLYSMARRYDEFPGCPDIDTGSSVRGAMKGWFKYGACKYELWPNEGMPKPAQSVADDWWLDAVLRPLGAYYRVDHRSVTDMQVALNEVGILYASAACHSGWSSGMNAGSAAPGTADNAHWWNIPTQKASASDGGHAFVMVGYNQDGFIIQNSWGSQWGSAGRAVLRYEDWLDNAMDCWVAQLGVVTDLHEKIADAPSLRTKDGKVQLATNSVLRAREIAPFIIDMENNGRLSNTGDYRTNDSDIEALVTQHLVIAREKWQLGKDDVVDIAIYAHGGLTSESDAAATAAKWIPALYDKQIFPIFLMWETDLMSTLKNRLEDTLKGEPRMVGGLLDLARHWWNERLEKLLAKPGTMIWGEMKQNGQAISKAADSGGIKLHKACMKSPWFADPAKVRLHLIGHSAGAIAHSYIVKELCTRGWTFDSINLMAPAVRVDVFEECVLPQLLSGKVRRMHQFHLADEFEQKDPTCQAILGYGRSLLYLVSQSFEHGTLTPILGMQKYFAALVAGNTALQGKNVKFWAAPCAESKSTTHGGFDDDPSTMASVIRLIKNS
ncbi:C1 family peptidase [soil metagenome]